MGVTGTVFCVESESGVEIDQKPQPESKRTNKRTLTILQNSLFVCVCLGPEGPKKTHNTKNPLETLQETPLELTKNLCVYMICVFFGLPMSVHFWRISQDSRGVTGTVFCVESESGVEIN